MTIVLVIAAALCLAIAAAFYWLNCNTPIQTRLPAVFGPLGLVLLVFVAGMLAGCSSLPRYPKTVEADGYLFECGKPYTQAEDRAGIEHDCKYYGVK